ELRANRVLCPADRVAEGGGALGARVVGDRLRDLEEALPRAAGDALDHLGRVAAIMALDDLKDAARMEERLVALGRELLSGADELFIAGGAGRGLIVALAVLRGLRVLRRDVGRGLRVLPASRVVLAEKSVQRVALVLPEP